MQQICFKHLSKGIYFHDQRRYKRIKATKVKFCADIYNDTRSKMLRSACTLITVRVRWEDQQKKMEEILINQYKS